jgi:hypothetical protein
MIAFFFAGPRLIIIYHTRRDAAKPMGTNTGKILDLGPIRGKTAGHMLPGCRFNFRHCQADRSLPEIGDGSECPGEIGGEEEHAGFRV